MGRWFRKQSGALLQLGHCPQKTEQHLGAFPALHVGSGWVLANFERQTLRNSLRQFEAGKCFTSSLTTGADVSGTLVGSAGTAGTTGADTFTATQLTYTTDDVLVGGEGADTLTITATGAAVDRANIVTGVETINVNSSGLFAATYDAAGVVAIGNTINVANSAASGSFAITNLGTGSTVGAAGVSGALSVTTTAATSQTLTLAANTATTQTVVLTHSGATDVATISAAGTVALTATTVETLNFSGNGAAVTYTVASVLGATANNLTGSQNVTLAGTSDNFTGLTITDNTTGTSTTTVDLTAITADTNLVKASADVVTLTGDRGAALALTVKPSQAITSAVAHATGDITLSIDNADTTYANGAVTLTLTKAHGTGKGFAVAANSVTKDNITTLNIVNSTIAQPTLEVLATATADVVISGTKAVTLETNSTAKSVSATGLSAALEATAKIGNITTITGGSANDTITITSAEVLTVNGGAGTADNLILAADSTIDLANKG